MNKEKKTVKYIPSKYDKIKRGQEGQVFPVDHTSVWVDNGRICYTSEIIRTEENGEFETMNSIYKPVDEKG